MPKSATATMTPARRPMRRPRVLRKRALRVEQDAGHPLFQFSLTPAELFDVADVSRVSRDDVGKLLGYQRPEVKRHVQDIVEYLDSERVLFPNSLILALSSRARFIRSRGPGNNDGAGAVAGTLEIRLPGPRDPKPAWIVDGQQRALALSKSRRQSLAVPVNAFVADEVDLQRDQFLRINNTRALPRGLITELLPEVSCPLPARLSMRKIPAQLCDLLNRDERSPFRGLIRRSSSGPAARAGAVVADMSIVKMIEESLSSPAGCLFPYRNLATGESDFDGIWAVLLTYWSAVKATFPDAWGRPPTVSRLMHGAGIRAMGRLMDRIMASLSVGHGNSAVRHVQAELVTIKRACRWTSGEWEDLGGIAWNELQNVPRHIQMLSNHLVRLYLNGRTGGGPAE
jgi:DGQHR domain-containing protein